MPDGKVATRICEYCKNPFTFRRNINRVYCSRQCKGLGCRGKPQKNPRKSRYPTVTRTCAWCRSKFTFLMRPEKEKSRFCSIPCHLAKAREERRKVPYDYDLLYDLYWTKKLNTVEIAKMFDTGAAHVNHVMTALGIKTRNAKERKHVQTECREPGCNQPLYKITHSNNGAEYGTRCYAHWVIHRNALKDDYRRRVPKTYKDQSKWTPEVLRNCLQHTGSDCAFVGCDELKIAGDWNLCRRHNRALQCSIAKKRLNYRKAAAQMGI